MESYVNSLSEKILSTKRVLRTRMRVKRGRRVCKGERSRDAGALLGHCRGTLGHTTGRHRRKTLEDIRGPPGGAPLGTTGAPYQDSTRVRWGGGTGSTEETASGTREGIARAPPGDAGEHHWGTPGVGGPKARARQRPGSPRAEGQGRAGPCTPPFGG